MTSGSPCPPEGGGAGNGVSGALSAADRARAAVQALGERARPALVARVGQLEDAIAARLEGRLDEASRHGAQRAAHQLAGSAGTFGLPGASELARQLEDFFADGAAPEPATLLSAVEHLEALRRELEAPAVPIPDVGGRREDAPGLLLAHPDQDLARRLGAAAQARGLSCRWVADLPSADRALRDETPAVVLLDLDLPGGGGLALLAHIVAQAPRTPTLVLTADQVFLDRVEAARAGAGGFLAVTQPARLIVQAALDAMERGQVQRARLLAVDDDPVVLAVLSELFQSAGMRLTTVSDPLTFWDALQETAPDLLLLDLDMPGVTGLELCRLVRGDPRWATLPVLVLTGSIDPGSVHEVFAAGADDYVAKPVVGPELLTRVGNRLDRVRLHRRLAETDPLTGLANRRKFDAEFARLCVLAGRYAQPLSFALLDLDAFKRVNDLHGHTLGDAVLQRLGAQLAGAFRGEDVVARWGGEEMAVAMYGMRGIDGIARMAGALEAFRGVSFPTATGEPLHVTFSAGVAEYGVDGDDLHHLYRAADDALYEAKRSGGDRVLPAGWRPQADAASTDVLLVEDDEVLAGLLVHAMRTRGLRCLHLTDGQQALRRLTGPERVRARVVLLDVDLPGLNGLDVLGELAREGVLAQTRVVMLTARSAESEVLAALRQGAFDHVAKPFSVAVLMQRIRRALDTPW